MSNTRDIGIKRGLAAKDKYKISSFNIMSNIKESGDINKDTEIKDFLKGFIKEKLNENSFNIDNKKFNSLVNFFIKNLEKNIITDWHLRLRFSNNIIAKIKSLKPEEQESISGDAEYFNIGNHSKSNIIEPLIYGKLYNSLLLLKFITALDNFLLKPEIKKYNGDILKLSNISENEIKNGNYDKIKILEDYNKELTNLFYECLDTEFKEFMRVMNYNDKSSQLNGFTSFVKKYMKSGFNDTFQIKPFYSLYDDVKKQFLKEVDKIKSYLLTKNQDKKQPVEPKEKKINNPYKAFEKFGELFILEKRGSSNYYVVDENNNPMKFNSLSEIEEYIQLLLSYRNLGDREEVDTIITSNLTFDNIDKAAYLIANNLVSIEVGNYLNDKDYIDFISTTTKSFENLAHSLNISSTEVIPKKSIILPDEIIVIKQDLLNELNPSNDREKQFIKLLNNTEDINSYSFAKKLYSFIKDELSHSLKENETKNNFYESVKNCFEKIQSKENVLGMCAASRGTAYSAAHYSPNDEIINITKKSIKRSTGVVAHEFGHFLDDFIGKKVNKLMIKKRDELENISNKTPEQSQLIRDLNMHFRYSKDLFISSIYFDVPDIKIVKSFKTFLDVALKNDINDLKPSSEFYKNNVKADSGKAKSYYKTNVELFARAFESMIYWDLKEKGEIDTFLVNIKESGSVYLNKDEYLKCKQSFYTFINDYREMFSLKEYKVGEKQKIYHELVATNLEQINIDLDTNEKNDVKTQLSKNSSKQKYEQLELF